MMSFRVRRLNPDETFCCSKHDVISVFGKIDESFTVDFGYISTFSRDGAKNGDKRASVRKGFNDPKCYALIGMEIGKSDFMGLGFLAFYILKKSYYSDKQRQKFVKEILPEVYSLFKKYKEKAINNEIGFRRYYLEVFMNGDNFIFQEKIK